MAGVFRPSGGHRWWIRRYLLVDPQCFAGRAAYRSDRPYPTGIGVTDVKAEKKLRPNGVYEVTGCEHQIDVDWIP